MSQSSPLSHSQNTGSELWSKAFLSEGGQDPARAAARTLWQQVQARGAVASDDDCCHVSCPLLHRTVRVLNTVACCPGDTCAPPPCTCTHTVCLRWAVSRTAPAAAGWNAVDRASRMSDAHRLHATGGTGAGQTNPNTRVLPGASRNYIECRLPAAGVRSTHDRAARNELRTPG